MSRATIESIAGPVLRARCAGAFAVGEAVAVGAAGLLGEVVRLDGELLVAQVYEDTSGLKPGDALAGSGGPLSVRLGPGLLGGIFDGLLRPLAGLDTPFIAPGLRPAPARRFAFTPAVAPGQRLAGGAIFGFVAAARRLCCLVPPGLAGEVIDIAAAGDYADDAPLCRLRDAQGGEHALSMCQQWPVRQPRPAARRLPTEAPLLTGQRVLDTLFPVALGGKAAIPGGFGTGKTVLLEALVKACSADIIVYLGCGERGNEMAGALEEMAALVDAKSGRPMAERTVIVANTSNMPVAAREASIYCAATIAEFFRDQGLDVALMADSTSRWAEALREVSGRLGELPGEGGYPAYLGSRLAEFYERAARVETLAGETGSLTLLGSISPQAGDFSEPVTAHTTRYVRSFWALDAKRAQARFYPAIHPLQSYSEDALAVAGWWGAVHAALPGEASAPAGNDWERLRRRVLSLLDEEARLQRMARIVGKDALQPRQRLTLLCAEVVGEGFLRQSAFSPNDRVCGPARQALMLRTLGRFLDLAEAAVARGASPEEVAALPVLRPLQRMGEEIAEGDAAAFTALVAALAEQLGGLAAGGAKEGGDAAAA
ncbi:V-type ATP synthase subunit A [Azospira restricta]|uniref:V-type ATP synthase subunit A n=1 Tax=Azospira restricta TaxID=404405 RepID=A0A974SLI7_9RHOO|nr:V-type ATP synthase subunit A [Azospira restricta]QRJ62261.1 V-type ATP synthase subunit A [Azospira restricta]